MNKTNNKFLFSTDEILSSCKSGYCQIGLILALLTWILDPVIDSTFLQHGTFREQLLNPDDHEIFVRSLISAILFLFGLIGGILMHRSRLAGEELFDSTQGNLLLLNSVDEGIYGANLDGISTFVNTAACRMLGYEADELIGKRQHALTHHSKPDGATYPREECPIYRTLMDGKVQKISDEVFWKKDGTSFPVEYTCTPVRDNGILSGVVVVFKDVTDHRQIMEDQEKLLHEKTELMKELQCMYRVTKSIQVRATLKKIFQDIANCIPAGWHYPDITRGKVIFDGAEYVSEPFEETEWRQSSDIIVGGDVRGAIEVYYLQECPELDEGPFMSEERNLINGISSIVNRAIERKLAEKVLRESVESLSNPVYRFNLITGKYDYISPSCINTHGYTREEKIAGGIDMEEANLHPDDLHRMQEHVDELRSCTDLKNFQQVLEYRVKHKSGDYRWVSNSRSLIHDANGKQTAIVGSFQDINKRKLVEDALRESEKSLNLAQDAAGVGSWDQDLITGRLEWSAHTYRQFGYEMNQIEPTYEQFKKMIHPDDLTRVDQAVKDAIEGRKSYSEDFRIINPDGKKWVMHAQGTVHKDSKGIASRFIGTQSDITEYKHTTDLLKQNKAISEMLRSIAISANASNSVEEIVHTTLTNICEYLGWAVGHAYILDNDEDKLVSSGLWHLEDDKLFQNFREISEKKVFIRGEGMVGRILQHREPEWISDLYDTDAFVRTANGIDIGLHSGIGLPILVGDHVRGVLEFFSEVEMEPNQTLLNALLQVGTQVGRVFERSSAVEELTKLSRAVEASSTGIIITDSKANIEYINPKFTEITGYAKDEIVGQNSRLLQSGQTSGAIYSHMWETILAGKEWKGEMQNRKADGTLYWNSTSISSVRNEKAEITHFIGIHNDVTHEYEINEKLNYQASHDALTGLFNRHEFERRANLLLSTIQDDGDRHAFCYLDLDQFKIVNDTCGHTAGDELLRRLGQVLLVEAKQQDTLARLGGDEFGILMEHCTLEQAVKTATTLLEAVQDFRFSWEDKSFQIGVSMGLVAITETTHDITELLKQADVACYMAKDLGRNRIHVYEAEDVDLTQRRGEMQWVNRIQHALEEDRFRLYAQSIVPLDGEPDTHFELLIRMIDEKGDVVSPASFLPAAERYNLITLIDQWVVVNAFTLLVENPVFLEQISSISINISGASLARVKFHKFVITQLEKLGIPPGKICFEITETAAIGNMSIANAFISRVSGMGCQFSLDDFGSGLSSFAYLKNLPVNYLKIDGMFVKNMTTDPIDHEMVKSINEIGHVMGMKTIAEFVENDEIKGMLKEMGVNYAQGYGIGKPMPLDELLPGRASEITS